MKVYGFLEKSQLENVSADLSNTLLGLIWYNTTDNKFRYYDGAVRSVVTEDGAQTLTNKTFSGGNISGGALISGVDIDLGAATDTNKIVFSSGTKAALDALTREAGSAYYATDENKYYGDDGISLNVLGGDVSFLTVTKTANATLLVSGEDNIACDATSGDITITLPTAVGNNGLTYKISKINNTNIVTIDGDGTETIGGDLTIEIGAINDSIIITSDGSNWIILSDDITYAASYSSDSGQSVPHADSVNGLIIYEDVKRDTHNSYNNITGKYTAPRAGRYTLSAGTKGDSTLSIALGLLIVYVNNTQEEDGPVLRHTNDTLSGFLSCEIDLAAGDVLDIRMFQANNLATAQNLNTASTANFFNITRIGN